MTKLQKLLALLTLALCTLFSCTMPTSEAAANNGLEITAEAEANETLAENVKTGFLGSEKIYYEVIDGMNIFQGDIILTDSQISSTPSRGVGLKTNLWPNNTVYYTVSPDFTTALRNTIKAAVAAWEIRTGLTFVEGVGEGNFIDIMPHPQYNYSNLGMIRGRQLMLISVSAAKGSILHEIGHAIGLMHEHSRTDRDKYINIDWNNIKPEKRYIFKTYAEAGYSGFNNGQFDFASIMLYPSYLASYAVNNTKPIFTKKDGSTFTAQRESIPTGDFLAVNRMYPIHSLVTFPADENFQKLMGFEKGVNIIPGDFDGDGKMDFITQDRALWDNDTAKNFRVYFSKGDGSYREVVPVGPLYHTSLKSDDGVNLIPGDYNGDGKTDFIRQEKNGWDNDSYGTFSIYYSIGDGTFNRVSTIKGININLMKADNGAHLIPGDYNGDGRCDFIRQEHSDWDNDNTNNFSIYFSQADGSFKAVTPAGSIYHQSLKYDDGAKIIPGDYNGDGKCDFIRQERAGWDNDSTGTFSIYYSKGNGTFNRVNNFTGLVGHEMKSDNGVNLIPGDFNGDGKCDFIRQEHSAWANNNGNTFGIYYSNGEGSFSKVTPRGYAFQYLLKGHEGANIIPGDINGDGKCDFIRQEKGRWVTNDDLYTFLFYITK